MNPEDVDPNDAFDLDPDLDDVPPEWAALDGKAVTLINPDGTVTTATAVAIPGSFGQARRLREARDDPSV